MRTHDNRSTDVSLAVKSGVLVPLPVQEGGRGGTKEAWRATEYLWDGTPHFELLTQHLCFILKDVKREKSTPPLPPKKRNRTCQSGLFFFDVHGSLVQERLKTWVTRGLAWLAGKIARQGHAAAAAAEVLAGVADGIPARLSQRFQRARPSQLEQQEQLHESTLPYRRGHHKKEMKLTAMEKRYLTITFFVIAIYQQLEDYSHKLMRSDQSYVVKI